ncbi:MAG: GNAT family N-acetyltransferase [Acidobacteriota bacterium]
MTDEDVPFLSRLYASTREEEMKPVPWSAAEKATFLQFQFEAQHKHYLDHYADSSFDIVEVDGEAVGRLYVQRRDDELRIVDIALLTKHRGHGLGGRLLRELLDEASGVGKAVRIHVEHNNPAMRLYKRLGFRKVDDVGVYHLMEWRPPTESTENA